VGLVPALIRIAVEWRLEPGSEIDRFERIVGGGRAPKMNVLLLSMPDSFEHMPTVAVRMPNGASPSIAGNVDPHHRVAIADLVLVQRRVRQRSND
jgi:hypothetical protein